MEWRFELALFSATIVFAAGLVVALLLSRRKKRLYIVRPLHAILVATFISLVILFFPVYFDGFAETSYQAIQAFFLSIYGALTAFVVNANIDDIRAAVSELDTGVRAIYVSFASALCIFSPVLIFSLALSMIKSASAHGSYFLGRKKDAYLFSSLSERSLALADSTRAYYAKHPDKGKKPLIVFAGVIDEKSVSTFELAEEARRSGAVLFKRSVSFIPLQRLWRSKHAETVFILIGADREENNTQALELLEKAETWNRQSGNTKLYVLESSVESEILLDDFNENMTVRRIDRVRSFVYNILWREGKEALFDSAALLEGVENQKEIRAHIIGVGKTGSMMLRSLVWLCQMSGYRLRVDAYDVDEGVDARLTAAFPELLDSAHNDNREDGEAHYSVRFHKGIDVSGAQFNDLFEAVPMPTFVFISLGDDDKNIEAAVKTKTLLLRKRQLRAGASADRLGSIFVVVHDLQRTKAISSGVGCDGYGGGSGGAGRSGAGRSGSGGNSGSSNSGGGDTRMIRPSKHDEIIKLVGGFDTIYSYSIIFAMELEEAAFKLHTYWYNNEPDENIKEEKAREFWSKESYRNSSMARKIHKDVRDQVIPEAVRRPSQRGDELNATLAILEHRRWLAYMRSEGYVYSGTTANESRNDRAMIHNLLVNYYDLPEKERILSSDSDADD
jgi:hypothetical protein